MPRWRDTQPMDRCITARHSGPLRLLIHVERWIQCWLRESVDDRRDKEAMELLVARDTVRQALQELLGPRSDSPPVTGLLMLIRVDARLTEQLAQARHQRRSREALDLRTAREIVRRLTTEVAGLLNSNE